MENVRDRGTKMQIDLFMEFASPPGSDRSVSQIFDDALALAHAADETQIDTIWAAEHHFLGDYSNASAPDMLLSAMARETRRINLGFAIIPLTIHDPVRVAERLATLDVLSRGRVRWGVGRGVTLTELQGFGVEPRDSRTVFRGNFETLRSALKAGYAERNGVRLELRPKPSPRLQNGWLAAVSPESFELAAELDLDVMCGPFKPWPMVKADLRRYRRLRPNGRVSFTLAAYCEQDHRAARRRAEPGILWAYRRLFEIAAPLLAQQVESYEHYRRLGRLRTLLDRMLSLGVLEKMGLAAVGGPDHVADRLRSLAASSVDRVSLIVGGGDLSLAETTRCLKLLSAEVFPRLGAAGDLRLRVATV